METLQLVIMEMTATQRAAYALTCLVAGMAIERLWPLVRYEGSRLRHTAVNVSLLVPALVVSGMFAFAEVQVTGWTESGGFGLLHWVDLPAWVELIIGIVALDFTGQYAAHWLLHRVPVLWRFHVVHHTDARVDASTGIRLHPGDIIVREALALAAVLIIGAPLSVYLLYRLLTIFFTFITHANVATPLRLDRWIQTVFVTPAMHKFHHHNERYWTDSNYGGILSVWDRLCGTYVSGDPLDVRYGVDVADQSRDEDLTYQLLLPLNRREPLSRNVSV